MTHWIDELSGEDHIIISIPRIKEFLGAKPSKKQITYFKMPFSFWGDYEFKHFTPIDVVVFQVALTVLARCGKDTAKIPLQHLKGAANMPQKSIKKSLKRLESLGSLRYKKEEKRKEEKTSEKSQYGNSSKDVNTVNQSTKLTNSFQDIARLTDYKFNGANKYHQVNGVDYVYDVPKEIWDTFSASKQDMFDIAFGE